MTKEIIEKITISQNVLANVDLTSDEKKLLYQEMERLGGSRMLAYTRFFRDGFSQWEIDGIGIIKSEYLQLLKMEEKRDDIDIRTSDDGRLLVYYHAPLMNGKNGAEGFEERSFSLVEKGDFWRFLGDIRHRKHFADYMAERGMKSAMTVSKRFSEDDWREWELRGIRTVVEDFYETYQMPA